MEQAPTKNEQPVEEILVDREEFLRKAEELFESNREAILTSPDVANGRYSIEDAVQKLPSEVLNKYWGHGVARGPVEHQIAAVLNILQNNAFVGSTARLAGSGYVDAYTHGGFLAISHKDQYLAPCDTPDKPQRVKFKYLNSEEEKWGLRMKLGALVVADRLAVLIKPLRQLYPDANIISTTELPEYIRSQEEAGNSETGSQ
jgi:hypothetical protein